MRYSLASLALAAVAFANPIANPVPQGVTSAIAPSGTAPSGCQSSYSGSFEIEVVNVTSSKTKRDIVKVNRNNVRHQLYHMLIVNSVTPSSSL
jgi:hypothetical protein